MNYPNLLLALILVFLVSCSTEKEKFVDDINYLAKEIDANRRVEIKEDDFHQGDTIYKIRGYYMDNQLIKLVSVTRTAHMVRDDYFYFDHAGDPLFTGHMINRKDKHDAAEYKYYYKDRKIHVSMFWEDHYEPGKQFPHEHFEFFEPDLDSLMEEENSRLSFFVEKLETEGFQLQVENEILEANSDKF